MCTAEMWYKISSTLKLWKDNHLLGNLSSNSNGQWIRMVMFLKDSFADSHGKVTIQNPNVSSESLIGLDFTLMNMLVTL